MSKGIKTKSIDNILNSFVKLNDILKEQDLLIEKLNKMLESLGLEKI